MAQRTKRFLSYQPAFLPEQPFLFRNAVLVVDDISELYGEIDALQRALAAQVAVAITNPLNNGFIFVGDATNTAVGVAMSGQATITNTGAVTLSNAAVIAKVLTGFVVGANTPIVAADSILGAFQKTQAQINAIVAGGVTSVSGTLNRITSTGGATPVIDISAVYVGQTSLTTLGTITTGTWNATRIAEIYGGTNQNTYAVGDILYASGVNTLSKLTATTNGFVLTLAAGVPVWAAAGGGTPSLTATQIAYGDGANLMTSAATFTKTTAKVTFTGDGTGALGSLYLTRGDAVNQYIVMHENVASPNSAYLTFKSSGGNAIAMGAIFAAGVPVSYVFTNASGVPMLTITEATSAVTALSLAGTGTQMVTADINGLLAKQAIPTIASLSPLTTKGDIFTFSTVNTRLGIGSRDGQILMVDAAAATGNKWSTSTYPSAIGSAGTIIRSDGVDNLYTTSVFADTYGAGTLLAAATANTVTGVTAIPNGVTATTQTAASNDTKVATDAYVDRAISYEQILQITGSDVTTTSNVASDITGLAATVVVNSKYYFSGSIHIGCNNTGGVKFAVTIPAGATMFIGSDGWSNSGTGWRYSVYTASGTLGAAANNTLADANGSVKFYGTVTTVGTAGTVQFQFASGTNTQTSTAYIEGTVITCKKVA